MVVSNQTPAVIYALVEAGTEFKVRGLLCDTPLHRAASQNQNPVIVNTLVKAHADVDVRNEKGLTPLHWTAMMLSIK